MLKLKLKFFGHLMPRADLLEKSWCLQRLRREEGHGRGWDGWMASLTQWTWVLVCCHPWGCKELVTLSDWILLSLKCLRMHRKKFLRNCSSWLLLSREYESSTKRWSWLATETLHCLKKTSFQNNMVMPILAFAPPWNSVKLWNRKGEY